MDNKKTHYVSVTGIIEKNGKYLICKRSDKEKAFPGKWCVPGGKIEPKDFIHTPKDTNDHWFNVFENVLKKEIREETSLKIKDIEYVKSIAFIRPNGYSTLIVSMSCKYKEGEVTLSQDELVSHAWVTLEEAKEYDLIEDIYEQIETVDQRRKTYN